VTGPKASRAWGLESLAPFFLCQYASALASIAAYRLRVRALLPAISPDLASPDALRAYAGAAALSDVLAASIVICALASMWLLSAASGRILGRAVAWLAALGVAAYSALMAASADFMGLYQAAFSKSFVGGEHFTGIASMLKSAAAEFSSLSRMLSVASIALVAALSALSLRARAVPPSAFLAGRAFAIAGAVALIAMVASGQSRGAAGGAAGGAAKAAASGGAVRGAAAAAPGAAAVLAAQLAVDPLSALVLGPARGTFMPPSVPESAPARYDTDSLEAAGADRFLPIIEKGRRNVILYFFESTSWAYYGLEIGGKSVMPALRDLASRGLLLENHYSNYPLSANTLYSVLSSRYSMYGKSMIFSEYYDVDVRTLPEVLSEAGYATCFIHTGDLLYASRDKFLADRDIDELILHDELVKDPRYRKDVGWGADERAMIDPAIGWIKARDRPYLLMMAPVNPHHPYAAPELFERVADPDEPGIGDAERTWRNYLNSLHYSDAALGLLVAALEREGLMEGTVLVVVTDHGEAFHQHRGNYNHPLFVYEENVHVPALFYGPGIIPAGAVMESITRHVDIMPSILDLLGLLDSGRRDGESIFSRSKEKMAVFHTSWNDELMGVRDGRWKYIERMKDSVQELYDLESDPREARNVALENPEIALRYRGVADGMAAYMIDQYRDAPRVPGYSLPPSRGTVSSR
jgi:arylsulfatase A-like enzyme